MPWNCGAQSLKKRAKNLTDIRPWPLREDCKSLVSLESRYGIWDAFPSLNFAITCQSIIHDQIELILKAVIIWKHIFPPLENQDTIPCLGHLNREGLFIQLQRHFNLFGGQSLRGLVLLCQELTNSYWCMILPFYVVQLFQSLNSQNLQDRSNSAQYSHTQPPLFQHPKVLCFQLDFATG